VSGAHSLTPNVVLCGGPAQRSKILRCWQPVRTSYGLADKSHELIALALPRAVVATLPNGTLWVWGDKSPRALQLGALFVTRVFLARSETLQRTSDVQPDEAHQEKDHDDHYFGATRDLGFRIGVLLDHLVS